MIDRRVEHVIRALGRETQVPMDIVETVVRRALPSIRLVPQFPSEMEAPAVGGCRIGGAASNGRASPPHLCLSCFKSTLQR